MRTFRYDEYVTNPEEESIVEITESEILDKMRVWEKHKMALFPERGIFPMTDSELIEQFQAIHYAWEVQS